ncbi:MAG: hypothetical protein LBE21_07870, partial [Pseudomonadales bacterium]|nr:hypothetical protein [Pseudomonadales bacterium]
MAIANPHRLKSVGPIDPQTQFPLWFEDENGTRLELVVNADPLAPAIGELQTPGAPLVGAPTFTNFPEEAFYYMAEARLDVGGNGIVGRARVIMALEAGFGGAETPVAGLGVVFARLRVRIDDVIPGAAYVVRHPYGETDPLLADEKGQVRLTIDLGVAEGNLNRVLVTGEIAPFMVWDGAPVIADSGDRYIGDGVTEHSVNNDPLLARNFVEISGPRIEEGSAHAAGADLVRTNLFIVQGRLARRIGVEATSTTYSKEGASTFIDVVARSIAGQQIELVATNMRVALSARGTDYVARVQVPAIPSDLKILNASDDPVFMAPIPAAAITDQVLVEQAKLDAAAQQLTVVARSSDPAAALSVESFGAMTAPTHIFTGVAAAPEFVTVTSNKKGAGSQHLELLGAGAALLGVAADASAPARFFAGFQFRLNGEGSRGAITDYAWSKVSGPAGLWADSTSQIARFTPSVAGTYVFRLTVNGTGGPSSDDVTVIVDPPPPPDVLTVTRAQYRTSHRQFRITGTINNLSVYDSGTSDFVSNEIVVTMGAFEIGRAYPDATGAWDVRLTLLGTGPANVPGV